MKITIEGEPKEIAALELALKDGNAHESKLLLSIDGHTLGKLISPHRDNHD